MSDLRERVARAMCSVDAKRHGTVESVWKIYLPDADAAIAICMEEAARIADAAEKQADEDSRYWEVDAGLRCQDIAAAIRARIVETENG